MIEDHVLMREGVTEILEAYDDLEVVGTAGNGQSAIAVIEAQRPDVVLLDVEIPGGDVMTMVKRIQARSPETKILILSMYDGPQLVRTLLDLGIKGYLLKNATRHQLVAAIHSAVSDDDGVVLFISRESLAEIQRSGDSAAALTRRERAILELVAEAMSNAQIASHYQVSEATVKRHLRSIFTKLGAVSRLDAVNKAVAAAQISPPKPASPIRSRHALSRSRNFGLRLRHVCLRSRAAPAMTRQNSSPPIVIGAAIPAPWTSTSGRTSPSRSLMSSSTLSSSSDSAASSVS